MWNNTKLVKIMHDLAVNIHLHVYFIPHTLPTVRVVDAPDAVSTEEGRGRAADQMARDHARIMENRKL